MHSDRLAFLLPDMRGGGAERVALTLIKAFVARGYSVDLLLMRANGELLPLVPAEVDIIDLGVTRIRGAVRPVARYLARAKPVALHISMWPLTIAGVLAGMVGRSGARIIVTDHSALSKQYGGGGNWHRRFLRWSMRWLYPRADARVVVAAETAKDLSDLSGLPLQSFEVIHNPVEPPSSAIAVPDIELLWGGETGRRILNVGRMTAEKNQILLLEAFAKLSANSEVRLTILGDGPLRSELEKRARDLGIADRVKMPGFIIDPTPYYRSADLFALSSNFEGYPLVLIEALRCGLPIVSTDCVSGPAEILRNGEFGCLTPCNDPDALADAMRGELAAPTNTKRLEARAEFLSGAHTTARYLELMTGKKEVSAGL
jgi:glycosyltransferase involved in cell wall biosynthesis